MGDGSAQELGERFFTRSNGDVVVWTRERVGTLHTACVLHTNIGNL